MNASPELALAILSGLAIAGDARVEDDVSALFAAGASPELSRVALDTLGRIGTQRSLATLEAALQNPDPETRAQAALALGLYGRRQIPLTPALVQRLCATELEPDTLAFGVAYALSREHEPQASAEAAARLRALAEHRDAEVRATALAGLARREELDLKTFSSALDDPDARVKVQAVRGLLHPKQSPRAAERLGAFLERQGEQLSRPGTGLAEAELAPLLEALAGLRSKPRARAVDRALGVLDRKLARLSGSTAAARINLARLRCLSAAAHRPSEALEQCAAEGDDTPPRHLQLAVALEAAGAQALEAAFSDADPRVRGAALAIALARGPVPEPPLDALGRALASDEVAEAGAVAEALAPRTTKESPWLEAVAARTARELDGGSPDLELSLTLLSMLSKRDDAAHVALCARASEHANRSLRAAATACLVALGRPDAERSHRSPLPPPHDVAALLGRTLLLDVETTKGRFRMRLDLETAPFAVATLVALSQEGFYAGLPFHRVVADFVVQGGDPTGTGFGGAPGVSLPAEPSTLGFGGRFTRGAVGIADAGLDTGSSQLFIMHSHAPHLDGRYTRVGEVVAGMEVVDRLIVGDRILSLEVVPHSPVQTPEA